MTRRMQSLWVSSIMCPVLSKHAHESRSDQACVGVHEHNTYLVQYLLMMPFAEAGAAAARRQELGVGVPWALNSP